MLRTAQVRLLRLPARQMAPRGPLRGLAAVSLSTPPATAYDFWTNDVGYATQAATPPWLRISVLISVT